MNRGGKIVREWTLAALLRERTEQVGDCHEWLHNLNSGGHPAMCYRGKPVLARRLAWCLAWCLAHDLELPDIAGLTLWASCLNKRCINPACCKIGTRGKILGELAKTGALKGNPVRIASSTHTRRAASKLTMQDVRQIRAQAAAGVRRADLAVRYGMSDSSIDNIVSGKTWRETAPNASIFSWRASA